MHTYFRKNQKILPNIHNCTHLELLVLVFLAPDPFLGLYHYSAKAGVASFACYGSAAEQVTPILNGLKQRIFTVNFIIHVVWFLLTRLLAKINLNPPNQYSKCFHSHLQALAEQHQIWRAPWAHSQLRLNQVPPCPLPSYFSSPIVNKYPFLYVVPWFSPFVCFLLVISLFKEAPLNTKRLDMACGENTCVKQTLFSL